MTMKEQMYKLKWSLHHMFLWSLQRAIESFTIPGALHEMMEEPHAVPMDSVCFALYLHVTVKALKISPARPPHSLCINKPCPALHVSTSLLGPTLDYLPMIEMYLWGQYICLTVFVCERDTENEKGIEIKREIDRKRRRESEKGRMKCEIKGSGWSIQAPISPQQEPTTSSPAIT